MSILLPQFIVITSNLSGQYLRHLTKSEGAYGFVTNTEPNVFTPLSKIEVEKANIDSRYIHLRFSHSNKYWARQESGARLFATSSQSEEDISKPSCTLFEPFRDVNGSFSFTHVQSGWVLTSPSAQTGDGQVFLHGGWGVHMTPQNSFTIVDWDNLTMIPKNVAFRADNHNYLRPEGQMLLFVSIDPYEIAAGHEVTIVPDGHIRLKSNLIDRFWKRNQSNWIRADSTDTSATDKDTLFWPVKVAGDMIALRSAGNNIFCKRYTDQGISHGFSALDTNITMFARLVVKELVRERQIFDVKFSTEDSRIYDEASIIVGRGSTENTTGQMASLPIKVEYQDHRTYSFSNFISVFIGVKTNITTSLPLIAKGKIEIPEAVTINPFQWKRITSEAKSAEATYTANVPPRSRVIVQYVATVGKCDVPFSYSQQDRSDGSLVTTQHDDGIYTGLNSYNFHFNQPIIEPL